MKRESQEHKAAGVREPVRSSSGPLHSRRAGRLKPSQLVPHALRNACKLFKSFGITRLKWLRRFNSGDGNAARCVRIPLWTSHSAVLAGRIVSVAARGH
ncbi:hypothetical protein EYF80_052382 [Liparis tanakae]|uniref:Uncharacterized protein n=1 Tax=Liparis tanakae TaxID=230148 RepID=A0A4Z2F9B3_9TELE|nr:hypothetical protein EYF80_052382 [Liparis tanakae]